MKRLLQSPWIASSLGMVLFLLTTVLCWRPLPQAGEEQPENHPQPKSGPSWTFHNPEIEQLIAELKREKEGLATREKQLNELAARLQSERQELNQVTQTVHELRMEFDRNVLRVEEQESANLKRLAKIYSNMAPENSVSILKQVDESTLVKIMALMKDAEVGPILEAMGKQGEAEAKRAAVLSERLRLTLAKSSNSQAGTK